MLYCNPTTLTSNGLILTPAKIDTNLGSFGLFLYHISYFRLW